jgi:CHAT domain-containing protein
MLRALNTRASRPIGLAVLAACSAAASTRGYDEAFSIATTLQAGGTCTVVSSLWSVPDEGTSVLMYLFHHFLRAEGLRPVDALREAQLCALGVRPLPNGVPPSLPAAGFRDGTAGILDWAGFVHTGQ